jgi:hypothetical protein
VRTGQGWIQIPENWQRTGDIEICTRGEKLFVQISDAVAKENFHFVTVRVTVGCYSDVSE